ncbi:MAG: IS1595 family transposase [Caulobacteraceae bacterium]|nr:IS1595 family transposase [Caulobacteraceae bacterium]
MSILSAPHFHNEAAAYAYVEARLWPNGPVCPHNGCVDRIGKMGGKSTRIGTYKCYQCRKPFTVKIGTVFESSHIPMRIWLQAMFLLASSKKGISTNQLHRTLGITLKSAWFLSQRIREAMRDGELAPFGAQGGPVEVDETYHGRDPSEPLPKAGAGAKIKILSLVDRESGRARSMVLDYISAPLIARIVNENLAREAHLMTDEASFYKRAGKEVAAHSAVNHSKEEYVRYGTPMVTTNSVEGFFSVLKRGLRGTYQCASKRHMHRYLAEFDFRYSHRAALGIDDVARTDHLLRGVVGKRLTWAAIGQ